MHGRVYIIFFGIPMVIQRSFEDAVFFKSVTGVDTLISTIIEINPAYRK